MIHTYGSVLQKTEQFNFLQLNSLIKFKYSEDVNNNIFKVANDIIVSRDRN